MSTNLQLRSLPRVHASSVHGNIAPRTHAHLRYDASVQLLLAETGTTGKLRDDQIHTPPLMSSTYATDYDAFKVRLKSDERLRARIRANNAMDIELYEWSVVKFCTKVCAMGGELRALDKYNVCRSQC